MKLLIDAEMKLFNKLKVEVVFLQNILADLLLGFGWKELFINFTVFDYNWTYYANSHLLYSCY